MWGLRPEAGPSVRSARASNPSAALLSAPLSIRILNIFFPGHLLNTLFLFLCLPHQDGTRYPCTPGHILVWLLSSLLHNSLSLGRFGALTVFQFCKDILLPVSCSCLWPETRSLDYVNGWGGDEGTVSEVGGAPGCWILLGLSPTGWSAPVLALAQDKRKSMELSFL